jgi:flavin-dependent dehydrogenase
VYGYFSGLDLEGYEWSYAPGAAAGAIPTNDGQSCVFVGGSEQMFRKNVFPNLEDGFRKVLRLASPTVADRVENATRVARFRGFAGVKGYTRQSQGPGWALVGDAGYFRDPITAHGISDAFRDAELLARAITGESSLAAYQQSRDEVTSELFEVTDRIAGYDWTMDEIRVHLKNLSRSMKPETKLIAELDAARAA